MKRTLFILLLLSTLTASAQDYQHSAGLYAGNAFGLSYKGYVPGHEHLVVEVDLWNQLIFPGHCSYEVVTYLEGKNGSRRLENDWHDVPAGSYDFFTLVGSPNFYYQAQAADLPKAVLNWYAGGGFGLGALWFAFNNFKEIAGFPKYYRDFSYQGSIPSFKFDEHATAGIEFCFKDVPLNLSIDFRPGCGQSFIVYAGSNGYAKGTVIECGVFFDWTAGVALRYRIGE